VLKSFDDLRRGVPQTKPPGFDPSTEFTGIKPSAFTTPFEDLLLSCSLTCLHRGASCGVRVRG
jgi:hypothetical protein